MNKEMQKLLKQINDKKNAVRSLANEGKMDEAKKAKAELVELQDKFNLLADLEDDDLDGIEGSLNNGRAKDITGGAVDKASKKKNLVKAFVNIVKCGFLKREPDEADVTVYKDALSSDTTANKDGEMGIGVTIPEDIRTDIIELRRSDDNLEQYVNVEGVTTKSGSRNIEVDAESVPFDNVEEEADFPGMDEPITLFDRNVMTIDMNDKAAGLWEKDMTGIKVRDRFDVQPVDEAAVIKGEITENVAG